MATELPQRGTMAGSPCYQQCRGSFDDQINFYPRSLKQLNEI
jgi:hypothetical protein